MHRIDPRIIEEYPFITERPLMYQHLMAYIERGQMPGGFLSAILENNLIEAVSRADLDNQKRLVEYVKYLFNQAPAICWGSPKKVEEYAKSFQESPSNAITIETPE